MRYRKFISNYLFSVLAVVILLASCSFSPKSAPQSGNDSRKDSLGFAVMELFTSEGCSSCPPADRLVKQLALDYQGRNVLFLGLHVDYWDHLGWKDAYSQHLFTERQQEYAALRHTEAVYTPQIVVNGYLPVTGSDASKINKAIEKGLTNRAIATISLEQTVVNDKIRVHYKTSDASRKDDRLVLVLVQKQANSEVANGENRGRSLNHINIVRTMIFSKPGEDDVELPIPTGLKASDVFVAAFLQEKATGHIISLKMPE